MHRKLNFHTCEQQNQMVLVLRKSKPHSSSRIKKKLEVLRGYCKGKGPKSYIGPWALSGDINWSEEKQMIIRCSQTKSRKQKANEKLSEEYILLGPTIYGSKSITQQLK